MRQIIIGSPNSRICATCQYWEGPNLLSSAGSAANPNRMNFDNRACSAVCIKKHSKTSASSSCSEHEYNFQCQRYI